MQTNTVTQQLSLADAIDKLTLDEVREFICTVLFVSNKPLRTFQLGDKRDRLVHIEDSFVD